MVSWGVTETDAERNPTADTPGQDRSGVSVVLAQLDDRRECASDAVPRATSDCLSGRTARLRVPGTDPTVTALDCNAQYTLTTAAELPDGAYLLSTTVRTTGAAGDSPLAAEQGRIHIRFDGSASLRPTEGGTVLSMWNAQRVTVGVGEYTSIGPAHLRIEESPAGLATGLSHLSAAHHTLAPSRSHPGQRGHPPLLTVGDETSIPSELRNTKPETGIELRVPPCVESLFVVAPLAYYLGAEVTLRDRPETVLTADGTDVHHEFEPFPALQDELASMVQRVFYLDCLVRRMNPDSDPDLLDRCSLDPQTIRSLSPAGRLERYLATPTDAVEAAMPEWHLSTHTEPSLARARCLPFLLDKLSLVYLSECSEVDRSDLLEKTLSDSYQTRGAAPETAMVEPSGGVGRVHGWLAPGTPIDAFKATPTAYENRYRYQKKETDHLQLSVVLNDMEMSDERHAVSEIYRAADLPMDVTVSDQLSTDELADVFESENDFVHFIGHCEDDGLCCPDGNLSLSALGESRTRTFFLNACGSYEQGLSLIDRGSVAGAVTFADVLDSHAAMVGTAFARLLSNGFSIQRALQLARRRIMMSKDYAVVGDGTYALLPGPTDPVVVQISETADGYDLTCEVMTPQGAGESYDLPVGGEMALNGTETHHSVSPAKLVETLESHSLPVIFEDDFHWSEDLAARLAPNF